MKKTIYLLLLSMNFNLNIYAFSIIEGYKDALKNDMDSYIKKSELKSVFHDQEIAESLNKPIINLLAKTTLTKSSDSLNSFDKSDNYGAEFTQNLFDGFEYNNEKKLQKSRYKSSLNTLKQSENKLSYLYVESYVNVLKAKKILALRNESLNKSNDILNKVYKKVSLGYGGKLEFEEAKSIYIKAKVDLNIQKINYKNAIESLKYFVQIDFDSNDMITPNFNYKIPSSLKNALLILKTSNPSYLVSKNNILVSKLEQQRELKNNYPTVDLVGSYDMYNEIYSNAKEYDEFKLGVELNYNLYDGGRNKSLDKKLLEKIKEKKYLFQKNKNQLENQLRISWNNYKLNYENVKRYKSYEESKQLVLNSTLSEFDIGLKTLINLMEERTAYINAKIDTVNSSYDYLLSKYKVLESIGTLSSFMDNDTLSLEDKLSNELELSLIENDKKRKLKEDAIGREKKANYLKKIKENKAKKFIEKQRKPKSVTNKVELNLNKTQLFSSDNNINSKVLKVKPIFLEKNVIKPKSEESIVLFKDKFLSANSSDYTINLAYFKSNKNAQLFLDRYNIRDKAFSFSFGKNLSLYKVMLGVYDDKNSAKKALKELPAKLKKTLPRVESIYKKQKLYAKYHSKNKNISKKIKSKKIFRIKNNSKNPRINNAFKSEFLNANKNKYTINLAISNSEKSAALLLNKHDITNNGFYFTFGSKLKLVRIVYGIFDNKYEAEIALKKLPNSLKRNRPIVERVTIKQKTFHKYHENKNLGVNN